MVKNKLWIISRYKEDLDWLTDYTMNYVVYNKGDSIDHSNYYNTENIGGNQRDICHYIYSNYDNLPELMVFVQGYPFDHCSKEVFDKLINNKFFTPLEYYGKTPANAWEQRDEFDGFKELNNSWYIEAHNSSKNQTCRYSSFDEFMNKYFENYVHIDYIRFSPGSQYIVEKQQALQYPNKFWESLMNEMNSKSPTEGHIIERALYHIFIGSYKLRKEFYE
jgi:hypothetical protein